MATISRYSAVAKVGKLEFGGFIAWLAWLVLHLYYLVGHRNRIAALFAWGISFLGRARGQMAMQRQLAHLQGNRGRFPSENRCAVVRLDCQRLGSSSQRAQASNGMSRPLPSPVRRRHRPDVN